MTPGSGLQSTQSIAACLPPDHARTAFAGRFEKILDTAFLTDAVTAKTERFSLGPLGVILLSASPRSSERRSEQFARDGFDDVGVHYAVSGAASGDANGRQLTSTPGSVMILDYSQPFSISDQDHRVVLNVAVPRALFPAVEDAIKGQHGVVLSPRAGRMLADFMNALADDHSVLPSTAGPALGSAFLSLLRVSQDFRHYDEPVALSQKTAAIIRRAERLVHAHIGSPDLNPAWLGNALHLSRSQLYTHFRSFGGVERFILLLRLRTAHAALTSPADTRRIGEISYACGFATDAHFARAFRAHYGETATSVRRAATIG